MAHHAHNRHVWLLHTAALHLPPDGMVQGWAAQGVNDRALFQWSMCTMIPCRYITLAGNGLLMVHALLLPLLQWLWLMAWSSLLIDCGSGTGAPPNQLSRFGAVPQVGKGDW